MELEVLELLPAEDDEAGLCSYTCGHTCGHTSCGQTAIKLPGL